MQIIEDGRGAKEINFRAIIYDKETAGQTGQTNRVKLRNSIYKGQIPCRLRIEDGQKQNFNIVS